MPKYWLRLYVTGKTPNSATVIDSLHKLIENRLGSNCRLEVVDLLEDLVFNCQRAQEDGVFATPTLVRKSPPPEKKLMGRLHEPPRVCALLGIRS